MLSKSELIQAIKSGDAKTLGSIDQIDPNFTSDDEVILATMRAAERVVFHRANYREALVRIGELGIRCDIWAAARAGLVDVVRSHLSDDRNLLNATNKQGQTALQRAGLVYGICEECEEVVDFLIKQGATMDVFTASTFCILDVVQKELEREPDVVSQRCQGSNALNWAVRPRRNQEVAPEICRLLITAGADVHDSDQHESGMTPLHHTAEWGPNLCLEIVDLLLDAGADLNGKDDQGWTPLDYAHDRKRTEMAQHLLKKGATSTQ